MEVTWEAEYKDGTVLKQYSEREHSTSEVDRNRLRIFRLFREQRVIFEAFFNPDDPRKKLIFRRRTKVSSNGDVLQVVYLVGWHENVKGVSVKSLCYVYEDGHIEFDDDRNDLELFPFEKSS